MTYFHLHFQLLFSNNLELALSPLGEFTLFKTSRDICIATYAVTCRDLS